jgi:flagellar protein FlbD
VVEAEVLNRRPSPPIWTHDARPRIGRARSKDGPMIALTRMSGASFAVNSDLIERVDSTPDTVVTLVDGTKCLVQESVDDVIEAVRRFRASVIASAGVLAQSTDGATITPLRVVHRQEEG